MMTFWRWFRRTLYTLFAVLLIAATAITVVLTTQPGASFILYAANQFAPGELRYERVEGTVLRDISIESLSYRQDTAIDVAVDQLHFRWRPWDLLRNQLHVRDFSLTGVSINIPERGPEPDSADTQLFPIELPNIQLPLDIRVDQLLVTDATINSGDFTQIIERASLRARTRGDTLHLCAFSATTPEFHAQLNGQVTPTGRYPHQLNSLVRVELPELGMTTIAGSMAGDTDSIVLLQSIQGNISANVDISVADPLTEGLTWQGEVSVRQLTSYPLHPSLKALEATLTGGGTLTNVQGRLTASLDYEGIGPTTLDTRLRFSDETLRLSALDIGLEDLGINASVTGDALITADQLDIDVAGAIQLPDTPETRLNLRFRGTPSQADELRLIAELEQSRFVLTGSAGWDPELVWDLELTSEAFDFSPYVPDYPGTLTAEISSSGRWSDDPQLELQVSQLVAELTGNALSGTVRGNGSLSGPPENPEGTIQAEFTDIKLPGLEVATASLELGGDLLLHSLPQGFIRVENIQLEDGLLVNSIAIESEQRAGKHYTRLNIQGEDFGLATELEGEWSDFQWQGQMPVFEGYYQSITGWELQRPVRLSVGRESALINEFCMARQEYSSELCADIQWDFTDEHLNASLEANELSLGLLRPWLPDEVQTDGSVSLSSELQMQGDRLSYSGHVALSDSIISIPEQDLELILTEGDIFSFYGDQYSAEAEVSVTTSNLEGGITAQIRLGALQENPQIDGQLQLTLTQLAIISVIAPEVQSVRGEIQGDLSFYGDLTEPVIAGTLAVQNGSAEVPFTGITLSELNATLNAPQNAGEPFTLSGSAMSGNGSLIFEGQYQLADHSARLNVAGENFTAMQTRDLSLHISPDVEVAYTPELLTIRGSLHVPFARISPPDFETVDVQSRDTRILYDEETLYEDSAVQIPVDMELQVSLGNDVQVSAFGFEGRITGRLQVLEKPGQLTSAVGNINVAAGQYEIYGQSLEIERGSLVFTGGPVNNPGLDLRVSRNIAAENVTVGARVGGQLREPNLNLFSSPAMQDSMILSYLIFGRAPGRGNTQEQNMLAQASLALGMRGGNFIGEQISDRIGVDEVMLDATGDNLESTSLFIGKHLSSRLYVKYGIGLVEPVTTFFIRYRLTENINFETQTGDGRSGADLFYTIER